MALLNPRKIRKSTTPISLLTILIVAAIGLTIGSKLPVSAQDLTGTDYKIEGATLSGGSLANSANYSLINTLGEINGNPYVSNSSYSLKVGSIEAFIANVPKVSCFETDSDGSSLCTTGPAFLNTGGVVRVCGVPGCYNRARIEIDPQNNPADALYGIQISSDNFSADVQVVDGITRRPKALSLRNLADYMTKTAWEANSLNIAGLEPNKEYWVRIVALHGDFTESSPSPTFSASTVYPSVNFDIDISGQGGVSAETSPPYTIFFSGNDKLFRGGSAQTAPMLIWLDIDSNAKDGVAIVQLGQDGGLYSANQSYLIASSTADLSAVGEGFGLQNFDYSGSGLYSSFIIGSGQGELSEILVDSNYIETSLNSVGAVSTSFLRVYSSSGPVAAGRLAMRVKAKASEIAPAETDYTETITFVAVPRY
jgi:hypothetical protein